MAVSFTTIAAGDLGAGTDQLSPETSIPAGYSERLINWDPKAEGGLAKRTGYQGFAGYLPVRVSNVSYTDDATRNLCFTLDRAVDFTLTRSTPLVAYGRLSAAQAGDFSSADSAHYYPTFAPRIKKTLAASSTTTLSIPSSEHGQSTPNLIVGLTESTSFINRSNSIIQPDALDIDVATSDLSITGINGTASPVSCYTYYLSQDASPGSVYVTDPDLTIAAGTVTTSIPAATHQLSTQRIMARVYSVSGGVYSLVDVDEVRILSNGTVEIDTTAASSFTAHIILSTCPLANYTTTSIVGSGLSETHSFAIDSNEAFLFPVIYRQNGSTLEEVLPDSFSVDDTTSQATVSFTNDGVGAVFDIYWQYGVVASNTLCVDATVITTPQEYTDSRPQLSLWGIDHRNLYSSGTRGGWVTHLDTYRSAGEQRVVSGLGGNLFTAKSYAEASATYLLPLLYPSLRARAASVQTIGPAFWETTDAPSRTRGYILGTTAAANAVQCTAIAFNSGTGYVEYTLSVPGMSVVGTLSTIISSTSGLEDYLTVEQAPWARLNGTFKIKSVSAPTATTLLIAVENTAVDGTDWDSTDCGAQAGVFTDRMALQATSTFIPGDQVLTEVFATEEVVTVTGSSGSTVVLGGLSAEYGFSTGQRIVGARSSSVVPLRELDETASVTNVVAGDMLEYTEIARQPRVVSINPNSTITVNITGDGNAATVTLLSGSTDALTGGQRLLLAQSGDYTGVVEVSDITSSSTFTFDSSLTSSVSGGLLVGKTVALDETLDWQDSVTSTNSFTVASRWIPIEAPDDSYDLTPSTYVHHLDTAGYDDQSLLRSVMSADNLYCTNGNDEVLKYDGSALYKAGLPRWQPQLFLTTDTTATGKIVVNNPTASVTSVTAGDFHFHVGIADQGTFSVGDIIRHSADGSTYTVKGISENGSTTAFIAVDKAITSSTNGTIAIVLNCKYYMRLNSIDTNNNIIASAITGADDLVAQLSEDAAIHLKVVGMPAFDLYDYDRLEVEIYRTKFAPAFDSATLSVFYRVATLPMSFNNGSGYLVYTDTDADDSLRPENVDPTAALTGAELGTTFTGPLRSKSITSAGGGIVLGNITDNPRLSVQVQPVSTLLTEAILTGKSWTLRKDNTDAGTSTDMVNRAVYEWVNSGSLTITGTTSTSSTFTVSTSAPHGQVAKNWVYLYRDAVGTTLTPRYGGWFQVASVPGANSFTVNDNSNWGASTGGDANRVAVSSVAGNVPVWLGADGNWGMYNGNAFAGQSILFLAVRRLASAINASMRATDVTLSGQSAFVPWVTASAGNEFASGQLVLEQPFTPSASLELELPTFSSSQLQVYGNGVLRTSGASVGARELAYPSRILISYPNYPELFDNPTAEIDSDSVSAVDVNPADGQEITAIIPFFGESAFGAAQKSGVVVVFKTNSVYLVDIAAKRAGQNAIQRLESRGLGCTAPGSVTVSRDGIMFANESGIYKLTRSLQIDYIGRRMERIWRGEVDRTLLALCAGHHYTAGSRYKLSVPLVASADTSPSQALVYDHTREYRADGYGQGSWTEYSNHPALFWCNLNEDAYFSTQTGQVFVLRRANDVTDYRDDAAAIAAVATLRATDFGDNSIRKVVGDVLVHYRVTPGVDSEAVVASAADLEGDFNPLDESSVKASNASGTGMSDQPNRKVRSIRYSLSRRRLLWVQLQISNSQIDQPLEVAQIGYRVAGMQSEGIIQAKSTT
jgi:hypothetical protein